MNPEDLRAFARRDWGAVGRSRLAYWAERYRLEGPGPARRAATLLYHHAIRVGAPMHGDAQRADDLRAHVLLRERLDRAARALAGR